MPKLAALNRLFRNSRRVQVHSSLRTTDGAGGGTGPGKYKFSAVMNIHRCFTRYKDAALFFYGGFTWKAESSRSKDLVVPDASVGLKKWIRECSLSLNQVTYGHRWLAGANNMLAREQEILQARRSLVIGPRTILLPSVHYAR